jgi:hypothetical protein
VSSNFRFPRLVELPTSPLCYVLISCPHSCVTLQRAMMERSVNKAPVWLGRCVGTHTSLSHFTQPARLSSLDQRTLHLVMRRCHLSRPGSLMALMGTMVTELEMGPA